MATFNDLVEETLSHLRGYVRDQEMAATLTTGIDSDDTTLVLDDASVVSRGRVEVDDELIYVTSVNRTGNTATVPTWGRGQDGTTAESHSANAKVTVNPLFPRKRVKDAINQVIRSLDLFGVDSTTFTWSGSQWTYSLPAEAKDVLAVEYEVPWGTPEWFAAKRWTFNRIADTTDFATGKSITIGDLITPGHTVKVTYAKFPTALSTDSDVFSTVTGLPESCEDVVVLGATHRLLLTSEAFRLNTRAVEPNQLDLRTQPGQPSQLSRYVYQLFRQRVDEEKASLLSNYPVRVHVEVR